MINRVRLTYLEILKVVVAACLLTCLTICGFSVPAYADQTLNQSQAPTMKVAALYEGVAIQGMVFNVYHVAHLNTDGTYRLTDTFKNYPVDVNTKDVSQLSDLATTLKGYVARDGITPTENGMTDAQGMVSFTRTSATKDALPQGLYLVVGLDAENADKVYKATPFLVSLPHKQDQQSDWIYDVVAAAKLGSTPKTPHPQTIQISAVKQWVENGDSATRPSSITVDLIRDGQVFDTKVLSADNSWTATWDALESGHEWTVVEKEVEGYTVLVEEKDFNFVITNTEKPHTPPGTPPGDKPSLPKTGVVWWPVVVFGGLGLILLFVSLFVSKRGKRL